MIIIDKATWQIDAGIPANLVVNHFNTVFIWLNNHGMLTKAGIEEFEDGIDDSASLNERLVTVGGLTFLEKCYDEYLTVIAKDKYGVDYGGEELEKIYQKYKENL
jgi:hypothetical protein